MVGLGNPEEPLSVVRDPQLAPITENGKTGGRAETRKTVWKREGSLQKERATSGVKPPNKEVLSKRCLAFLYL